MFPRFSLRESKFSDKYFMKRKKKIFPSTSSAHRVYKAPLAVSENMLRGPSHTEKEGTLPIMRCWKWLFDIWVRKKEEKKSQENRGFLWKERILTGSMMMENKDNFIWKNRLAAMVLASIRAFQRTCVLPLNPNIGKDGWVDNSSHKERWYQHDRRE